ncbi:hypothetical protein OG331_05990 [Streptomyces sp. NBC_01017]|uniref:hypothetical protein n=1 Tax=Streptomyces sp. NBC_01017 TaxID=2903721 RepID=UPI00386ED5FD|nr:hypothetical protein OG331_05990 [Streptomyces sp. NBC_01017]
MSLVVGLPEQHELSARRRVEELREEADRIQAELALTELERNEWAIARSRVGAVLVPENGNVDAKAARDLRDAAGSGEAPNPRGTAAFLVRVMRQSRL